MEQKIKVAIFGVTGYTGIELLRILSSHKNVSIDSFVSSSHKGKRLSDVLPTSLCNKYAGYIFKGELDEKPDLAFLCTPHEFSLTEVPKLIKENVKVIDLSGAYRIKKVELYQEYYNFMHEFKEILEISVYGLPEIFREEIRRAKLVANPGCYPTATLLAIYPFIKANIKVDRVIVHAVSGVSGAGRKMKQVFHFPEMEGNSFIYSPLKHRHVPEMEDVLERLGAKVKIRFTPSVIPVSRGMISTVYIQDVEDKINVYELFYETYREEKFIFVKREPVPISWVRSTNYVFITPLYDERTDTYIIISVIDNLGKGASSQAVQNMNIMLGYDESEGILGGPLFV